MRDVILNNVNPEIIILACERYLFDRKKTVEKRKEDFIKEEMKKRFFPAKTKEEAIKRAIDEFGFVKYEIKGFYWEEIASQTKKYAESAKAVGLTMSIKGDILELLYKYIDTASIPRVA